MPQMVKNMPAMQETWLRSLGWEDPREKGTATHSSVLAWRIPMDKRSLVGYSPRGHKKSDTKYTRSHFIKLYQNSSQGHVIAVDIFF